MRKFIIFLLTIYIFSGTEINTYAQEEEDIIIYPNEKGEIIWETDLLKYIPLLEEELKQLPGSVPTFACIEDDYFCILDPVNTKINVYNWNGNEIKIIDYTLPDPEFVSYNAKLFNKEAFNFILTAHKPYDIARLFDLANHGPENEYQKEFKYYTSSDFFKVYTIEKSNALNENYVLKALFVNEVPFSILPYIYQPAFIYKTDNQYIYFNLKKYKFDQDKNVLYEGEEYDRKLLTHIYKTVTFNDRRFIQETNHNDLDYRTFLIDKEFFHFWGYSAQDKYGFKEKITSDFIIDDYYDEGNKILITLETTPELNHWYVKKYDLEKLIPLLPEPIFSDVLPDTKLCDKKLSSCTKQPYIYKMVQTAHLQGWLTGYPDGTLRAGEKVNRVEFGKMEMKAFGMGEGKKETLKKFPDVILTEWYTPYVSRAVELGIMKGYGDGKMKPENNITVAEGVKMTIETMKQKKPELWTKESIFSVSKPLTITTGKQNIASPQNSTAAWYTEYMEQAKTLFPNLNFLNDDPNRSLTRGECIELISTGLEKINQ